MVERDVPRLGEKGGVQGRCLTGLLVGFKGSIDSARQADRVVRRVGHRMGEVRRQHIKSAA